MIGSYNNKNVSNMINNISIVEFFFFLFLHEISNNVKYERSRNINFTDQMKQLG